MLNTYFSDTTSESKMIPIIPLLTDDFATWMQSQAERVRNWVNACNFSAKTSTYCLIPDALGNFSHVLLGVADKNDFWSFACLPTKLQKGNYKIVTENWSQEQLQRAVIAWGLGSYTFSRYRKKNKTEEVKLQIPAVCEQKYIIEIVKAIFLVRDLINTPAEDMNPAKLAECAKQIANSFTADIQEFVGDELLINNFPAVHMVGRASVNSPRLIDIRWGDAKNPKVTLVGKGVCFDSGGLDIKPSAGMISMKKDMGGAAHVLALAQLIMAFNLPLQLRVIIPIVENLVSGSSYKPGDVVKTRKGTTIEITNTDAEGRLILADALAYACEDSPDLIIDIATLTGAAKVALGTEIAALFASNNDLACKIIATCANEGEAAWQLPLFPAYKEMLKSQITDLANCSSGAYAGAITAALFLQEFVEKEIEWMHFDIMGANVTAKPGRPIGGEAMCMRGLFAYLQQRFAK